MTRQPVQNQQPPGTRTDHGGRRGAGRHVKAAAHQLVALALVLASLSACGPKKGSVGCTFKRPKVIAIAGAVMARPAETAKEAAKPKPKPKPTKTKERKKNCEKQDSPVWKSFTNKKNGWKTDGTYYYKWDDRHKDIEKYDSHGRHQGSVDPSDGSLYKDRQPRHDLPKSKRDW